MILNNELLRYDAPENHGISSESILRFLDHIDTVSKGTKDEFHSFYMIKDDCVIACSCASPHKMNRYHRIYSAAKGIVAIGILFALQEGLVSLQDRVVDLFPSHMPDRVDERMQRVTLYHLLTMNSGHGKDTCMPMFESDDWIRTFMSIAPDYEPGTHFTYNNGIPHILAAIIQEKTGMNLHDYLKPRLLDILDMDILCRNNNQGEYEPSNVCATQEGLAKIGYLFLKKGVWNGQQLISKELVRQFGAYHVPTGNVPESATGSAYGWQVWKTPKGTGYYFAGGRDNHIVILPDENMVFTCMANNESAGPLSPTPYGAKPYHIVPIFFEEIYDHMYAYPIAENPIFSSRLKERLEHWTLAPEGSDRSSLSASISGKHWEFSDNPLAIQSVSLDFDKDFVEISTVFNGKNHTMRCGLSGRWLSSTDLIFITPNTTHGNFTNGEPQDNLASGAWRTQNEFVVTVRSYGRIQSDIFYFKFDGNKLSLHISTAVLARPGFPWDGDTGQYDLTAKLLCGPF